MIWVQGCSLGCPGCFNPSTHAFSGGYQLSPDALFDQISALDGIEGITVSGGEPLQQAPSLLPFLQRVRTETHLSVLLFSGYDWHDIRRRRSAVLLLDYVDVLLAGRFQMRRRLARGLLGSSNKTVHFLTSRYDHSSLASIPEAEVLLEPDGTVLLSGIDPLTW